MFRQPTDGQRTSAILSQRFNLQICLIGGIDIGTHVEAGEHLFQDIGRNTSSIIFHLDESTLLIERDRNMVAGRSRTATLIQCIVDDLIDNGLSTCFIGITDILPMTNSNLIDVRF